MALSGRLKALLVAAFVLWACLPASAITFQNVLAGGQHVVYDRGSDRLYVSLGSTAPAYGDSIAKINPHTGIIEDSVWVGLGPNALALSDDGQYLYVALDGSRTVRRVHLSTFTAGLEFGLGSHPTLGDYQAKAIAVMPGAPGTIAVARMLPVFLNGETQGIAIFDDGVQRPDVVDGDQGGEAITFGPDGSYVDRRL